MTSVFKRFASDESGATAIEYGMIAALGAMLERLRARARRLLGEEGPPEIGPPAGPP